MLLFKNPFIISFRSSWFVFEPLLRPQYFFSSRGLKSTLFWLKHGVVGVEKGDVGILGPFMCLKSEEHGKGSHAYCYYSCSSLERKPWKGRVPGPQVVLWAAKHCAEELAGCHGTQRKDQSHRSVTRHSCCTSFYSLFHYFKKVILIKGIISSQL